MEMILIKIGSPEWDYMWNWIAEHPLNKDNEQPTVCLNNDEAWQYMGSYIQKDKAIHEFRHRNHPLTNRVEKLSVNASEALTDDQIEKRIKKQN